MPASAVKYADFYSCFPCVVQTAADALGMKHDDPRGFTVTGGLPFYGQFACSAGALVSMVDRLRADTTAFGVITGNGGWGQAHSAGLYSAVPPKKVFKLPDLDALQARINALPSLKVSTSPSGLGTVDAYTVPHDQSNAPVLGVVVGRLENGERFVANTEHDPAVYKRMMEGCIGATGQVTPGDTTKKITLTDNIGSKFEVGQPNRFVFDK